MSIGIRPTMKRALNLSFESRALRRGARLAVSFHSEVIMSFLRYLTLNLFSTLLFSSISLANGVGVNLLEGNTVVPVENTDVRMVSEEVIISSSSHADASVTANFVFQNLSDKPVKFTMGFPIGVDIGVEQDEERFLEVWLNKQKVSHQKGKLKGDKAVLDQHGRKVIQMYYWPISFSAKEKISVKVTYAAVWGIDPSTYPDEDFLYITKTGALWKDTIEKADFYMTLPDEVVRLYKMGMGRYKLDITPSNFTLQDNKIEWHFTNWKPTEDISVSLYEAPPSDDKAIEELAKCYDIVEYSGDKYLYKEESLLFKDLHCTGGRTVHLRFDNVLRLNASALRNEIFARHGRIFNSPEMKRIFQSARWYRPRQDFKETELNEIEKKNIDFILNYEKKKGWK